MATPAIAKHNSRTFTRIMAVMFQAGTLSAANRAGRSTIAAKKRRVWTSAGVPSGAAPSGLEAGDFILDVTNDEVYTWITGTTYVKLSATA